MSVGSQSPGGEFDLANPLGSYIDVVRRVVLNPISFFAEVSRHGSLLNPLLFALICGEISTILGGLLGLAGIRGTQGFQTFLNPAGVLSERFGFIVALIATPIISAISLFIGAGILQLAIRVIIGAENSGFEGTFRIPSYAAVVNLVSWIPIIGTLLSLYGLYLQIVGLREIHETTTGKAILTFVAYLVVFIILAALIGAVVGVGFVLSSRRMG